MTASSTAKTGSGFTAAGAGRANGLLGRITRAWEDFRAYRTTLSELEALTDGQLSDLGLGRGALRSVAHRAVYGR